MLVPRNINTAILLVHIFSGRAKPVHVFKSGDKSLALESLKQEKRTGLSTFASSRHTLTFVSGKQADAALRKISSRKKTEVGHMLPVRRR